jgi:hypothetical protein
MGNDHPFKMDQPCLDGGDTWVIITHEGITIKQVNRMEALGEDIWTGDLGSSEKGMIHASNFDQT